MYFPLLYTGTLYSPSETTCQSWLGEMALAPDPQGVGSSLSCSVCTMKQSKTADGYVMLSTKPTDTEK